jgi:hypothetical protein
MPSAASYASLAEIKAELALTDTTDDTRLERVLEAVSEQIDSHCDRHFFLTEAAVARYFTAVKSDLLIIPDLVKVSALAIDMSNDGTFEEAWVENTDYQLAPYNAAEEGKPFTQVEVMGSAGRSFPKSRKSVKITGVWGWPSVPKVVTEACLIQTARIFRRSQAPFGIAQVPTLDGAGIRLMARLDPDVELLLRPVCRSPVKVA